MDLLEGGVSGNRFRVATKKAASSSSSWALEQLNVADDWHADPARAITRPTRSSPSCAHPAERARTLDAAMSRPTPSRLEAAPADWLT